ncbi:hypothetical protein AB4Z54_43080, partial [Streptomyces sp. MCAF7]
MRTDRIADGGSPEGRQERFARWQADTLTDQTREPGRRLTPPCRAGLNGTDRDRQLPPRAAAQPDHVNQRPPVSGSPLQCLTQGGSPGKSHVSRCFAQFRVRHAKRVVLEPGDDMNVYVMQYLT